MTLESDVKRMSETRPFNLLPREALQLIAFSCEKRALRAGRPLFAAGEDADGAFLVLSGEILLTGRNKERRVGPGALIGETALIAEIKRGVDAQVAKDATLLSVPRETFRRVLSEFPESAAKVRAGAIGRTRALLDALEAVRVSEFEGEALPPASTSKGVRTV